MIEKNINLMNTDKRFNVQDRRDYLVIFDDGQTSLKGEFVLVECYQIILPIAYFKSFKPTGHTVLHDVVQKYTVSVSVIAAPTECCHTVHARTNADQHVQATVCCNIKTASQITQPF